MIYHIVVTEPGHVLTVGEVQEREDRLFQHFIETRMGTIALTDKHAAGYAYIFARDTVLDQCFTDGIARDIWLIGDGQLIAHERITNA